jgi:hypothetical protein
MSISLIKGESDNHLQKSYIYIYHGSEKSDNDKPTSTFLLIASSKRKGGGSEIPPP